MDTAPVKRYRTFEYHTRTRWQHDKEGVISSEGKPDIDVASPPEFKGVPGKWTPEDLFIASIDLCQMTTFLAFAARAALSLKSYESRATGVLENDNGGYRFTRVVLSPIITVNRPAQETDIKALVESAHAHCLIGRSVNSVVSVEPTIHIV